MVLDGEIEKKEYQQWVEDKDTQGLRRSVCFYTAVSLRGFDICIALEHAF